MLTTLYHHTRDKSPKECENNACIGNPMQSLNMRSGADFDKIGIAPGSRVVPIDREDSKQRGSAVGFRSGRYDNAWIGDLSSNGIELASDATARNMRDGNDDCARGLRNYDER